MRNLLALVLFLAASLSCWPQSTINGVQPTAVDGVTVVTGATQIDGVSLTAPGGGGATPTFVQSHSTGTSNGVSITFSSAVTSGNVIIVTYYYGGGPGATITFSDSLGNTYATAASTNLATDGDTIAVGCAPVTTGGTDTVSFLVGGVNDAGRGTAYEYSNATCTQDVTAITNDRTGVTSCNTGSITTSTNNDLLIGMCATDGTQTAAITAGSGWGQVLNASNSGAVFVMSETQVGTTAGSFNATSGTVSSQELAGILVAYKP
jgi:hypothetical protein